MLVSVVLAGIHRNTGLVFDTSNFSSVDARHWFGKYLDFGESCYDRVISVLRWSGYFKQRNLLLDSLTKEALNYLKNQTGRDVDDYTKK